MPCPMVPSTRMPSSSRLVLTPSVMSEDRRVNCHFFADGQPVARDEGDLPLHATVRRGAGDIILLDHSAQSFYASVSRVFYGKAGR